MLQKLVCTSIQRIQKKLYLIEKTIRQHNYFQHW